MTRLVLALCWLLPTAALAAPQPAPAPPGSRTVSLEFQGTLRDALKKIAAEGGLSLIVTGNLDEPTEVMLRDTSPEEALATVARLHHLQVERQGNIWTVRRMTAAEEKATTRARRESDEEDDEEHEEEHEGASVPPIPPAPGARAMPSLPPMSSLPPMPPLPPMHKPGHLHGVSGTGPVTVEEGQTVDDAVAFGGDLTVNGHVQGDAVAFGGNVHLGKTAVVDGDVTTFGGKVSRDAGAEVGGEVTHFGGDGVGQAITSAMRHAHHEEEPDEHPASFGLFGISSFILRFALLFGIGFLALMFAPGRMKLLEEELRRDPLRCGLVGFVGSLALIPLTLLLVVTLIGIPLALALWVMVCLGMALGFTAFASELGLRMPFLRGKKTQAIVLAVGLAILLLVGKIPVIGPISLGLISLMSLGAIIRTRFGGRRQGVPQPL